MMNDKTAEAAEIERAELLKLQAAAGYVEYAEGLPKDGQPLVITRGPIGLAPGWVQAKHANRAPSRT